MEVPTVYMREPIGVDGALEATQAIHFCSTDCRERWQNWHPDRAGTDAIGFDTDGELIDGEVCNACGAYFTDDPMGNLPAVCPEAVRGSEAWEASLSPSELVKLAEKHGVDL